MTHIMGHDSSCFRCVPTWPTHIAYNSFIWEYSLFYMALLQRRHMIFGSLLIILPMTHSWPTHIAYDSFICEYGLFYTALLQKRHMIFGSLLIILPMTHSWSTHSPYYSFICVLFILPMTHSHIWMSQHDLHILPMTHSYVCGMTQAHVFRDSFTTPMCKKEALEMLAAYSLHISSHGTRVNGSRHTYGWVTAQMGVSRDIYRRVMSHIRNARLHIRTFRVMAHTCEWVTAHVWTSHGTHLDVSRDI